ncbi:hypothetical protein TD95_000184 [Thielaviopsis punctulata]|uniref:Extracellular serine-rich protein n=1 Tax=Thielaviopsis punctulata TaxID=72032 RepID=A0A0F4ZDS6_9PEZI|nr:hypothetical protein TD95_000184 [Thielaviopsis punctulata]
MLASILLLAPLALGAPSRSLPRSPTLTSTALATTRTIAVGRASPIEPFNIFASPGDVLEFHFATGENAVVQSSFDAPCAPLPGGFSSGLFSVPAGQAQSTDVFAVTVGEHAGPLWFYLAVGDRCNADGAVGVVNADTESAQNINAFREKALMAGVTVPVGGVNGGTVKPNPNPNAGF